MFKKLSFIEEKFEKISEQLSDPGILKEQQLFKKLCKERSEIEEIVEIYRKHKKIFNEISENEALFKTSDDLEFKELLRDEIKLLKESEKNLKEELKTLMLPKDANDNKNVVIEIRGGAGGDEAALFCRELYRMYSMYAEQKRWKVEILSLNEIGIGGIKEIVFEITGTNVYSKLKFESGVHRVQRVPETESKGRVHTSTVTVAVLPEVEEIEIDINPDDLEIDTYRSGGAGGQHINKTESAIRITHVPSGIIVTCQDERSQHRNRELAMKMLRAKLYDAKQKEQNDEIAQNRKSQVGSGDRSEKIRTYNFPQNRITDHRISLTLYKLDHVINGELDEIIDALSLNEKNERLKLSVE